MGNGASAEGRPQTAGGSRPPIGQTAPAAFPGGDVGASSRTARSAPADVDDTQPAPFKKPRAPPLTEATLQAIDVLDVDADTGPAPQSAMARLERSNKKASQKHLRPPQMSSSVLEARTSPHLSPHPPDGVRPARPSPLRPGTAQAPPSPSAPPTERQASRTNGQRLGEPAPPLSGPRRESGTFARGTPSSNTTAESGASRATRHSHGLVLMPELSSDVWCPPEFGPVLRSPQLSSDDTSERNEDQKTMFYQVYLQTHGGSVTNTRLKQRASAAVLIRERARAAAKPGATTSTPGPSPSPVLGDGDPAISADPVDADKYVTALYTFSREKTKSTFFIDQDGEMRRLYHTSGWHRLPPLSALANLGSTTSLNSNDSAEPQPQAQAPQKTHRSGKSSSSRKKSGSNSGAGGSSRKSHEKRGKTRPRSSSLRSGAQPPSFTSASQWSLGSHSSADSEFFTSKEPPPMPQPILMRNSSFRRTTSTSSLKYTADGDRNEDPQSSGAGGGTGELPSANKGRSFRPRVSFTANTTDFRKRRATQPSSGPQSDYSYDWDDDDDDAAKGEQFLWAAGSPGSPVTGQRDTLALLKGKMRT